MKNGRGDPEDIFHSTLENFLLTTWRGEDGTEKQFKSKSFFTNWFRVKGTPILFLFKKNLSQTNIQFAELLALVRAWTIDRATRRRMSELQFMTLAEFIGGIEAMVSSFLNLPPAQIAERVIELYGSALRRIIVVEPHFGSATVFIPPHLTLDHQKVCAESGYVHSCGRNVFTRPLVKADPDEFITAVSSHVETKLKDLPPGRKLFFAVYAHEDFTAHDREQASELRGGLDDVKIYAEKYYLGNERLVSVLHTLRAKLKDRLVIPEPGDFNRLHNEARRHQDVEKGSTIWLIIDRGVGRELQVATAERFLICYDQDYHNGNPFHLFYENKPAWVSHTTIPHTLVGAMINVTQPWNEKQEVRLADPFGGSGTSWLEALKYGHVNPLCADIEPIVMQLVLDNLSYFTLKLNELKAIIGRLGEALAVAKRFSEAKDWRRTKVRAKSPTADLLWALEEFSELEPIGDGSSFKLSESFVARIGKHGNQFRRLLLYIALRTAVRHAAELQRKTDADDSMWFAAFFIEGETLRKQFTDLAKRRKREEEKASETFGNFSNSPGSYSWTICIPPQKLVEEMKKRRVDECIVVRDARCDHGERYDVIVCDPPYGFNTESDQGDLADIYAKSIRCMVRSLRDGGQLVICLPARSHTGREIPQFTMRGFVTQQVLTEAEEMERDVVSLAQSVPSPGELFKAPYYWESERALRRLILHFRFRERAKEKVVQIDN